LIQGFVLRSRLEVERTFPKQSNMTFFQLSKVAVMLVMASAQNSFSSRAGWLESNVTLHANGSWYVGGFCFGKPPEGASKAAEVNVRTHWSRAQPLREVGEVVLAAYYATSDSWINVRTAWDEKSCTEKLAAADDSVNLHEKGGSADGLFHFMIHMHQHSVADWHFVLLACGDVEQEDLSFRMTAVDGVLNMVRGNQHLFESSCPELEEPAWVEVAGDQVGFWLLLAAALLSGCFMALVIVAFRHWRNRAKGPHRRFEQMSESTESGINAGSSPVIGRPCGEVKVATGMPVKESPATPEMLNASTAPDNV